LEKYRRFILAENKEILGWLMYDFANSAFATTIVAAILPLYFVRYVVHNKISICLFGLKFVTNPSSLWAYAISVSTLFVALTTPVLGAIADSSCSKKKFLFFYCYFGCICTSFLYLVEKGDYWMAIIFFILANIGFESSNVFYNAFLKDIAPKKEIDWISGKGFAYGYLGGGILLAINLLMIAKYEWFGLSSKEMGIRLSFITVSLWWAIFALPTFYFLKERKNNFITSKKMSAYVQQGFRTLFKTLKKFSDYKQAVKFLIAFLIYNEGVQTVIVMAIVFGAVELRLKENTLIGVLLMVQFVGIPGALFFGQIAQKIGAKRSLLIILIIWTGVTIYAFFMQKAIEFWVLGVVVGFILGGTQALSRSLYALFIPKGHYSEFFGFYAISNKFASIFGPLGFGLTRDITGSLRYSMLFLAVFFLIGMIILSTIEVKNNRT